MEDSSAADSNEKSKDGSAGQSCMSTNTKRPLSPSACASATQKPLTIMHSNAEASKRGKFSPDRPSTSTLTANTKAKNSICSPQFSIDLCQFTRTTVFCDDISMGITTKLPSQQSKLPHAATPKPTFDPSTKKAHISTVEQFSTALELSTGAVTANKPAKNSSRLPPGMAITTALPGRESKLPHAATPQPTPNPSAKGAQISTVKQFSAPLEMSTPTVQRKDTDGPSRLPKGWSRNMALGDQCWIGLNVFTRKKHLVANLRNWWHPPVPPGPDSPSSSPPCAGDYFRRRLFLWMPKRMWNVRLDCPRCVHRQKPLTSKGLYTRVRLVLDVKDYYYLAAEYLECTGCKGTFIGWDYRLLDQLSDDLRLLFPVVLTYKYACDLSLVSLLRARSLGNSCTSIQKRIDELHSEEWMRKSVAYLSSCVRHKAASARPGTPTPVAYQTEIPMKPVPSPKWFLACYVRDVYHRIDLLKAAATSVFGTILKIDSTKKVAKKLQGLEAGTAKWMTNVGNEWGQVLVSVLTTSESTSSLRPMADGLVDRFARAKQAPPLVLYADRDCCASNDSKLKLLFSGWPDLVVRLDIFHYMRRLAAGCHSESHPLYGVFLECLAQCIFEWNKDDLERLHTAKTEELKAKGISDPAIDAVQKATTKEEMARHCRRRTRGPDCTSRLIDALLDEFSDATDCLGVPLFREEMLSNIWPEQRRHLACIHDPPGIQLYTVTGHITKGGVKLPIYRCARGSSSLECFHLHQATFIAGTAANPLTYQACLLEGVTRWNSARAAGAVAMEKSSPLQSFDISLKHRLNSLSKSVRGEELLPNFVLPGVYTGERIGVDYLRPQADDSTMNEDLDDQIDKAVGELCDSDTDTEPPEDAEDITLALPADLPSELTDCSNKDNGSEFDQSAATDANGLAGWDKVSELADALLRVNSCLTDAQVVDITRLYSNLEEYDRKPLTFSPRLKKATGRFKQTKTNRSAHVGVEAMARCFMTAGQPASPPSRSRVVEAICIRLCDESEDQRSLGADKAYLSKWKVVLRKYNRLRRAVYNSPLHEQTSLQLFPINESTLSLWFKNCSRRDEVKLLMQGHRGVPNPPLASEHQFLPAQVLPTAPPRPEHAEAAISDASHKAVAVAISTTPSDVGEGLSRTTAYRRRRKALLEASQKSAADGAPAPKRRMQYTCMKCQKPQNATTGHSQFYGQVYCPFAPGQIPKEEWLAGKKRERAEKKKNDAKEQT